jgi:hypothetical protein
VIENCTFGLEIEKDHIDLLDKRAFAYYALGQRKEAEADYERAAQLSPRSYRERLLNVQAHLLLGYFKAGRQDAKSALTEAAFAELVLQELSPEQRADSSGLHHNLACIYAELSKSDEGQRARLEDLAIRYLQTAVEIARQRGQLEASLNAIRNEDFSESLKQRAEYRALHPALARTR